MLRVNLAKTCDLFVQFKSYLLKFRRQYELLCCLLAKIGAFLQNWELTLLPFLGRFCIENGRCWLFVIVLCVIHRYHIYKEVWNPCIGEAFMCFADKENSHDRKALLRPEVYIAITQYQGVPPLPILEVLLNFRVDQ